MTMHAPTLLNTVPPPEICFVFAAGGANRTWVGSGWNIFTESRFGARLGIEVTVWCVCGCSE